MKLFHSYGYRAGHQAEIGDHAICPSLPQVTIKGWVEPDALNPNGLVLLATESAEWMDKPEAWGLTIQSEIPFKI